MTKPEISVENPPISANHLEEELAAARKQIRQLTEQNQQLQARLKHAEETDERNRLLEARNEDLIQFAYMVSHDLQEPLRMITSYLQLVAQRYENQLDEEATEFIGFAVDGAKRMKQLISDLLIYSRVGQKNRAFAMIDLDKVFQLVLINLGIQIREATITVTYDKLPTLVADKTQMLQLLQNLLSNAIKFRNNEDPKIHVSAYEEEDNWIIQVSDNGIGIEPKGVDKIFAIFQRLHTMDEYPGSGIGLAICKKIVQNHQGAIWVESQLGSGSVFSFSIPKDLG